MVTNSEIINDIKKYAEKYGHKNTVMAFEQNILDSAIPYLSYVFARNIKGANIKAHGQAIIDSGDLLTNFLYPRDIEGADVKAHEQVILDNGSISDWYRFAKYVKGANIQLFEQKILDSGNLVFMVAFARDIEGANVTYIVKKISEHIDNPDIAAKLLECIDSYTKTEIPVNSDFPSAIHDLVHYIKDHYLFEIGNDLLKKPEELKKNGLNTGLNTRLNKVLNKGQKRKQPKRNPLLGR